MKKFIHDFTFCGLSGWCLECAYTGFCELLRGNLMLTSSTSLWMFFIYGLAAFIVPVYNGIKEQSILLRATIYGLLIICIEFISGSLLSLINGCPWKYHSAFNYMGLIRLDYFPLWMIAGLLFEFLTCHQIKSSL